MWMKKRPRIFLNIGWICKGNIASISLFTRLMHYAVRSPKYVPPKIASLMEVGKEGGQCWLQTYAANVKITSVSRMKPISS